MSEPADCHAIACRVIFVRHGEGFHNVVLNQQEAALVCDPVLTPKGEEDARSVFCDNHLFDGQSPQLIIVSPLWRVLQTAVIANGSLPPEKRCSHLQSWDLVASCNNNNRFSHRRSRTELARCFPDISFVHLGSDEPPKKGTEHRPQLKDEIEVLKARCHTLLLKLKGVILRNNYKRVLVFSHGGVIRNVLACVIGLGRDHTVAEPNVGTHAEICLMQPMAGTDCWWSLPRATIIGVMAVRTLVIDSSGPSSSSRPLTKLGTHTGSSPKWTVDSISIDQRHSDYQQFIRPVYAHAPLRNFLVDLHLEKVREKCSPWFAAVGNFHILPGPAFLARMLLLNAPEEPTSSNPSQSLAATRQFLLSGQADIDDPHPMAHRGTVIKLLSWWSHPEMIAAHCQRASPSQSWNLPELFRKYGLHKFEVGGCVEELKKAKSHLIQDSDVLPLPDGQITNLFTVRDLTATHIPELLALRQEINQLVERLLQFTILDDEHNINCSHDSARQLIQANVLPVYHYFHSYVNVGYHQLHLHTMLGHTHRIQEDPDSSQLLVSLDEVLRQLKHAGFVDPGPFVLSAPMIEQLSTKIHHPTDPN